MTGLPAGRLGLGDRGVLREGARADVVVFDPAKVRDTSTHEDPRRFSEGVEAVVINGRVVVEGEGYTGDTAGEVLRRTGRGSWE